MGKYFTSTLIFIGGFIVSVFFAFAAWDGATNYPGALDTSTELYDVEDDGTVQDEHHDALAQAVIAIETKLGIDASTPADNKALIGTAAGNSEWGTIDVPTGGTGAATFTDGGILIGNAAGAFVALGVAANGQIPIGDGTTDPQLANITETGDALTITNTAASIDLAAHANVEALADGTVAQSIVAWPTSITTRDADATPEVAPGGFYKLTNAGALTVTNFHDSAGDDESEFANGDEILILLDDADITIDFSANAEIEGNAGVDFTASASQITLLHFVYENTRWNCTNLTTGMSDPTTLGVSAISGVNITLDDDTGFIIWGGADEMADDKYNGVIVGGIDAGEAIGQWDTVFIKADADPIWEADATVGSSEYPAFGIAVAAASDTAPVTILTQGVIRNEGWTGLTVGGAVYLGEADGTLTQTAPSTANDCVQIIGWAISDSEIYFDFSRPYQLVE